MLKIVHITLYTMLLNACLFLPQDNNFKGPNPMDYKDLQGCYYETYSYNKSRCIESCYIDSIIYNRGWEYDSVKNQHIKQTLDTLYLFKAPVGVDGSYSHNFYSLNPGVAYQNLALSTDVLDTIINNQAYKIKRILFHNPSLRDSDGQVFKVIYQKAVGVCAK